MTLRFGFRGFPELHRLHGHQGHADHREEGGGRQDSAGRTDGLCSQDVGFWYEIWVVAIHQ